MNKLIDLRQAGKLLKKAMECPQCGGSVMIAATSHKGHGTGVHGSVNYRATGFERADPAKHCTCPGGPCWKDLLASEIGGGFRLEEGQHLYPNLYKEDGKIAIFDPEEERWLSVPAALFRQAVTPKEE